MKNCLAVSILVSCTLLSACTDNKDSPRGFSLPEGNVEAGKEAFTALQCTACHSTKDVAQKVTEHSDDISIVLGGNVGRVKTYADLVTSIINPSHRLVWGYPDEMVVAEGESRMRNYNSVMKVQQLVDLVTYLQPQYPFVVETPSGYRKYDFN